MEHLLILFFATYSAAFMATVPPGLLNMNAAKTSVEHGKKAGLIFGLGVAVTVMVQAFIAVMISKYLVKNPHVVQNLMKGAIVIFAGLAIYFFLSAKKGDKKKQEAIEVTKGSYFIKGAGLAALNLLNIPYYSGLNIMWNTSGWIQFELKDTLTFVLAAAMGSFTVLYMYTVYVIKFDGENRRFSKNSNYILSALMVVLLVITTIRIIYE